MHRTILLLCCVTLGLAPGCSMKRSYDAAAASPDSGSYGGGGDAPPPPVAAAGPEEASFAKRQAYDDEDMAMPERAEPTGESAPTSVPAMPSTPGKGAKEGGGEGPKTQPPLDNRPKPTEAGKGKDDETKDPQKVARQIIYTAEMAISVFKLDEAMDRAESLALESGGYVQSMSQGYYILRVPAAKLRGIMAELGKLGVVESRSLQAQDVTEEFVDLSTRIRVLRETQQQLISLLKQARNVEEALNVRRSLDQITMELEQAMGRLRMLESLIGFSTLTVRMSQRGPQNAIPSSNDPFPWVDGLGVEATEWN
jgi:hypothetical protein